jgi:hypothetical protein
MANILAIDLGFGSVKVAFISPESGELILDKYISATAKLTEKPEDLDQENAFQLVENYYVLGAQALKLPREYLMPLNDYETLKAVTPIWISFLLSKYTKSLGVKFDRVCIGLSLAYKDKADDLLQNLEDVLMLPKETFFCLPQGTAAKVALEEYGLSLDPAKRTGFKFDSFVLTDIGSNTIDVALITGSMASTSSSVGLENQGVCKILFDIIDYIYKSAGVQITTDEAKVVLDTGIFRRRGRNYDLSEQVKTFTLKYLTGILDLPDGNPKISSLVDNVQRIILIGGGAQLWKKYQTELIPEIEKRGYPSNFWVTPEKDAEYFNAISYLLIGRKLLGVK